MKMKLCTFVCIFFPLLAVGNLTRFRPRDRTETHHIKSRNSSPNWLKSERLNAAKHSRDDKQSNFVPSHLKNREIFSEEEVVTRVEKPGVDSRKLKEKMYNLLGKIKTHPEAAIYTLMTGEVPQEHVDKYGTGTRRGKSPDKVLDDDNNVLSGMFKQLLRKFRASSSEDTKTRRKSRRKSKTPQQPAKTPEEVAEGPETHSRARRRSKGVMYLPVNHPQPDPCAPPKGSKLMEALPLVFLSTILSVADAVGNVVNNINSNNNNNNNNNDNNVNNDNTNLGANVNNANQINVVPLGGRALRIARAVMNSIGRMAMGVYEAVVPSALWRTDTGQQEPDTGGILSDRAAQKIGDDSVADSRAADSISSAKRHSVVMRQAKELFRHQDPLSTSNLTSTAEKLSQIMNTDMPSDVSHKDQSNYKTYTNDKNVSLLFDDAEMSHMINLCTGEDDKPVDVHLFHTELSEAERVFRVYLKKLREHIPFMFSEK